MTQKQRYYHELSHQTRLPRVHVQAHLTCFQPRTSYDIFIIFVLVTAACKGHMEDVPDPTDFPPEADAPGLQKLDSAFSCRICGEMYDAPMMLGCGHSFCSMCVRRSLRDRHECPTCRVPAEEVQLVKNAQLEDLCDSWRTARTTILQLVEKVDKLKKAVESEANDSRPRKKLKTDEFVTPRSRRTLGPSTERSSLEVIDDDDSGLEEIAMPHNGEYVPSSDVEENEVQTQLGLIVNCPLCGKSIVNRNANEHIDSGCKSFLARPKGKQADTKSAWNNILGKTNGSSKPASRGKGKKKPISSRENEGGTIERLPKPSYSVLKDKKVREMLAEQELSTAGSREQLIARHTQFVLLFNANLDRAEHLRKSTAELRRELKKWEDSQEVKKTSIDDAQTYIKTRNAEFKKHIEAARASLRNKMQDWDAQQPPTASSSSEVKSTSDRIESDAWQEAIAEQTIISDSEGELGI
ncbi:uncharacterized protein FOMMEDRAFT_166391 [Fomitiporia mediterranea MF3/22]|uniref:uncharacterized protein n=1 Tax=Fomitiporia mediterranea (strain MF3/22) TaxID=694068 RepID=UPI0004409754|nr:uncharacterized protein FOMMEDRAFT_166391 [Fomitiporia mediterranea MF3/22]EJD06122.1 hypothetical protein FOMMEDRAFT_166391 [Fomitiporia mediterranea MF3/22]